MRAITSREIALGISRTSALSPRNRTSVRGRRRMLGATTTSTPWTAMFRNRRTTIKIAA